MNVLPLRRTIIGSPTRLNCAQFSPAQQKARTMNRINALPTPPDITAMSPAIVMAVHPGQAELRTEDPVHHGMNGRRACLTAWERVRAMPARAWLAPPRAQNEEWIAPVFSATEALAGRVPYAAIAVEVERALEHGVRGSTALACVLLASIALESQGGGDDAAALAQSALDLAAQMDQPDGNCVRVMHAALVTARTKGLPYASEVLVGLARSTALQPAAQLHLAGTAFAAGMPLAELAHHLEGAKRSAPAGHPCGAAQATLALRVALIRALLCPESRPGLEEASSQEPNGEQAGLAYWLTRLQAAWYAGRHEKAVDASRHAAASIGPSAALADLMCYHLFSTLALGRSNARSAASAIDMHCLVLHRFACAGVAGASAIASLASAVRERFAGKDLAALHGLERACGTAARSGQHWVAGLASEEAALAAANAGLDSAAAHYRQQALASHKRWGALGRVDMLEREWGDMPDTPAAERCAESERQRRASKAGEIGLSIAHEVNQPLAAIALHTAAARKWLRRPQPDIERALASLDLIGEAGRHAGAVVRGIQRLASRQENDIDCVSVDQTIEEVLRSLQRPIRKHGVKIELVPGLGGTVIHANRVQMRQVLTNLIVNAIEALAGTAPSPEARRIRVESRPARGEEVEILVEDNGPGIAPQNREHVFGSLFTTKPDNTGLGLSISMAIIRAHHGCIEFEPREPHGARFRVCLPVRGPQSPALAAMV